MPGAARRWPATSAGCAPGGASCARCGRTRSGAVPWRVGTHRAASPSRHARSDSSLSSRYAKYSSSKPPSCFQTVVGHQQAGPAGAGDVVRRVRRSAVPSPPAQDSPMRWTGLPALLSSPSGSRMLAITGPTPGRSASATSWPACRRDDAVGVDQREELGVERGRAEVAAAREAGVVPWPEETSGCRPAGPRVGSRCRRR